MKSFIAFALLVFSAQTFAQRSMVTLSGFDTGDQADRSLNLNYGRGGSGNSKLMNINLNYAYAITEAFQIGLEYKNYKKTSSGDIENFGDSYSGYGAKIIYNFAHKLKDTTYVSIGYGINKIDDSDDKLDLDEDGTNETDYKIGAETGVWNFEIGHRFSLGTILGMNFNYSPSANLSFTKTDAEVKILGEKVKDESSTTNLTLNFVKFDVLF